MCDSFVALGNVTAGGHTLFAKVSDRAVNEPQYFTCVPAADHAPGEKLRCTFIEVEQAAHTHAVILSKPSWIWGAEIGVNEFGVCAGNETVYTRQSSKTPALMGMDMVRLALERGKTAKEALDVAASMLEKYGQGGNCSFDEEFYYDNSFLFADVSEAWVLETSGRNWAAKKVTGAHSISNFMTIRYADETSGGAVEHALENGFPVSSPFDFTAAYTDWGHPGNLNGMARKICSQRVLDARLGQLTIREMIDALQSHTSDNPFLTGNFSVCKHAVGRHGLHQSTNSMAVEICADGPVIWGAGMSIPCCSIYKPFWFDAYSEDVAFAYGEQERGRLSWLRREGLNRAIIDGRIDEAEYKAELRLLQDWIFAAYKEVEPQSRADFAREAAAREAEFVEKWLTLSESKPPRPLGDGEYQAFWNHFNAQLGRNRTIAY
ncbi:MAG: C69 family dipeptidase [Eubacteriales bacterium]|nr:C69 family dipeptidase [Christensenellaceae bacterium]MEA5064420.1 C69 family dipeptidase [Eubacteriales bacterium]